MPRRAVPGGEEALQNEDQEMGGENEQGRGEGRGSEGGVRGGVRGGGEGG